MAAFCWMLVEGIYFYLFIVKVYNISNRLIVYHVMAWGIVLLSIMTFLIFNADLSYFESVYSWYDFPRTLTSPFSLCVKVSPSLWSALLSASQLEKEGFKATSAINSKKQSFRSLYLLFSFLSMFWFISDLGFLFKKKKITYICLSFCWNLYFCFFCELVHVLFRSFSCTPFQPSNTISHITLILFFFFL